VFSTVAEGEGALVSTIAAQKQRLLALLGTFPTCMLLQFRADGSMLVRPVLLASASPSGIVLIAIINDSPEVATLDKDGEVTLVFQSDHAHAWMRGVPTIDRSRATLDGTWDSRWETWFPDGPADPLLQLVSVAGTEGEYWDRRCSGGLGSVLASARALLTGSSPAESPPHGRVKLASKIRRPSEKADRAPGERHGNKPANAPDGGPEAGVRSGVEKAD
jgi:general stress protein 26